MAGPRVELMIVSDYVDPSMMRGGALRELSAAGHVLVAPVRAFLAKYSGLKVSSNDDRQILRIGGHEATRRADPDWCSAYAKSIGRAITPIGECSRMTLVIDEVGVFWGGFDADYGFMDDDLLMSSMRCSSSLALAFSTARFLTGVDSRAGHLHLGGIVMLEIERTFADEWLDFVVALTVNEGLDSTRYELLKNSLQSCAESWRAESVINRVVAGVLVDIFPAMESCADAYLGEERSRIGRAA